DRIPLNGAMQQVQRLDGNEEAFRNAAFGNNDSPDNLSINADWDSYWNTGSVKHHLKVGAQYTLGWWDERELRTGQLSWRPEEAPGVTFDAGDPSSWGFISSDWGADINLVARTTNAALYLQDYVTLSPRLSLSGGLRLNYFRGDLTPGDGSGSRFKATDDVKIAPRIGATFVLLEDQGLVAKAHWGRYYQNMFAQMFDRTIGGNVFTDLEFWDWVDPGLPVLDQTYTEAERDQVFDLFLAIPLGEEVGPVEGWSQPYMDQFIGGLEWEFADDWKAGALYVNRRNRDIVSLVDRNQATNYTEVSGVSVLDVATGDPVLNQDGDPLVLPSIFISNEDIADFDQAVGGFFPEELEALGLTAAEVAALTYDQELVLTSSDARREMDQVQVTVERAFRTWSVLAAVVWTNLRGDFFTVNGYADPRGSGAGPFVRPNARINFFGNMPNYSEWEVMVRAVGDLPANFRAGGFLTLSAGDFYTPVYRIDTRQHDFIGSNGTLLEPALFDAVAGSQMFLEQRGSRTLDQLFRLDLHVDWTLKVRSVDWLFALDVFNVFNSGAVTEVKNDVNNQDPNDATTLFGATRFFQNPRNIRLSASLGIF
ncbi:MAG: TonB-dependent receptor, partial [Gemmatimonadales bacterium]